MGVTALCNDKVLSQGCSVSGSYPLLVLFHAFLGQHPSCNGLCILEIRSPEISVTASSKTQYFSEEFTGLDAPSPSITPSCRAPYPFSNNLPMAWRVAVKRRGRKLPRTCSIMSPWSSAKWVLRIISHHLSDECRALAGCFGNGHFGIRKLALKRRWGVAQSSPVPQHLEEVRKLVTRTGWSSTRINKLSGSRAQRRETHLCLWCIQGN